MDIFFSILFFLYSQCGEWEGKKMETLEKSENSLETTGRGERMDCVWGHFTGRLKWRNSDRRIWAKTGQKGEPRKWKTWTDWKDWNRQRKKEEAPPRCDRNQSCIHSISYFCRLQLSACGGPRLVRDSTDTGNITIDYLYYNHTIVLSYSIVRLLQYYDSIHYT